VVHLAGILLQYGKLIDSIMLCNIVFHNFHLICLIFNLSTINKSKCVLRSLLQIVLFIARLVLVILIMSCNVI